MDEDGEPLINDSGDAFLPSTEGKEYEEPLALYLMAYAAAYRDVGKALQHRRTGGDQKLVGKLKSGKGSLKSKFGQKSSKSFKKFSLKRRVFKKGVKPKRSNPRRHTTSKNLAGNTKHRTAVAKLGAWRTCAMLAMWRQGLFQPQLPTT